MAALGSNMKGKSPKPSSGGTKNTKSKSTTRKSAKPKAKAATTKKATTKPKAKPVKPAKETPVIEPKVVLEEKKQIAETKTQLPPVPEVPVFPEPILKLKNAEIVLQPSKRRKIRKIKVLLEGALTINNVDALIERIEPIFDYYDYVDFYLQNVTALDLCFIQMLYHTQMDYALKQKEVTIDSSLSKELKSIVVQAGFEELMFIPKLV